MPEPQQSVRRNEPPRPSVRADKGGIVGRPHDALSREANALLCLDLLMVMSL